MEITSLDEKITDSANLFCDCIPVKDVKQSIKELMGKLKHIRGCGRSCGEGFSDAFHCGDEHLCFECEYPINEAIEEIFGKGLVNG